MSEQSKRIPDLATYEDAVEINAFKQCVYEFVFSAPSTWDCFTTGAGTALDLSGSLDSLVSWQRRMDDTTALRCDAMQVRNDFHTAVDYLTRAFKDEVVADTDRQEALFDLEDIPTRDA